ncbi:beta C1 protein [Betasatellite andrographis]|uniref:Beta C1 protein n=1 Tax=Betasatellite andrographis TaxID=1476485 RepID=W8T423_9VIRU|nr:beta C1 protein [Andrographis yellow vein leaf curl betasatellite]AHM27302.1 beta C1 protein [Andrographis yellow vein leaf curl betasatellite]AIO11236.1 beta C1 protein [Andrographis yellow vein leaf curl betasatellite]ALJ94075.1 beta C1 protein [Andrographis yellow vein leaf curl betasatellite]
MTITYKNKRGMEFIIDVMLRGDNSIIVQIELISTRSPALLRRKTRIPYSHTGVMIPFNFNELEEGIGNTLDLMYQESPIQDFKQEDMVEAIDILLMHEAHVLGLDVDENYVVSGTVTA